MNAEESREKFGQRIQRCYGCFVGFYLKDMWLGEGGTFYCTHCKDETMFHFDDFSTRMDFSKAPGPQTE